MARRIIGLDLGTYALKGALIETGMRDFRLVRIAERRLPQTSSETALGSVVSTALQELMSDLGGAPDVVVTGLTGERVFSRKLTLPFSDRKKIDSVIGFELEGVLPTDIEGLVYDYQVQAATDDGVEIFAVSAEQSYVGAFLRMLSQANIDPKVVDYEPYSYLNLIGQLPQETDRAIAVLDIGHRKTDLCIVVNGEVVVARTISRGGHQITREIAKAFDVEEHEAEALKHQRGFLALDEQMPTDPNEKRLAEAIRRGIFPLVRDVHQTLATSRAATSKGVATLHICGGGARLGGLVDYFESALGVTVEPLRISALPFAKGADLALVEDAGAKALALGLGSASDKRCSFINFRRGPFSYAGDFQFIRDRLRWVAIVALIFVALFSVKALQKYLYLSSTATAQKKNLEELTKQLTGSPIRSFKQALARVSRKPDRSKIQIVPEMTAFHLFYDIMKILAETNQLSLHEKKKGVKPKPTAPKKTDADPKTPSVTPKAPSDSDLPEMAEIYVDDIHVRAKTVFIQARANAIEAKNKFIDRLNQYRCFKHQKIDEQNPRTLRFGNKTVYRFSLTIGVACDPPPVVKGKSRKRKG